VSEEFVARGIWEDREDVPSEGTSAEKEQNPS